MKERGKREYILVARYENVFAGLRHWGVMFWGGAVVRETWEVIRPRQKIFAYRRVGSGGSGQSCHGFYVIVGEVYEEAFGFFVF